MTSQSINVTEEYKRVRDLILKVKKFNPVHMRGLGYRSADDVASDIFLRLFERGFWDKWNPERMKLSSYTYLGVKSLVINEKRAYFRRKDHVLAKPEPAPEFAFSELSFEDEPAPATDLVCRDYDPEEEVMEHLLIEDFYDFLSRKNCPHKGISYSDVFALLELKPKKDDREPLLGIRDSLIPPLIKEVKEFYYDFIGLPLPVAV